MKYYVYAHYRGDDGKIFYIGKGSGRRFISDKQRNPHWKNIVNKVGFTHKILMSFQDEGEAYSFEKTLIKKCLKHKLRLVNSHPGGLGGKGFKMPESAKNRIKLSLLGHLVKDTTRQKIASALIGRSFKRPRRKGLKSNNRKRLLCIETDTIFDNTHEAGRIMGLSYWNIAAVCRGIRKRCGGFTFKYI